eukprot:g2304.t1
MNSAGDALAGGAGQQLLGRWEKLATEDGDVYYCHSVTGVTTWDKPADFMEDAAADEAKKGEDVDVSSACASPSAWIKHVDESTGLAFYVNEARGVSQWEVPAELDDQNQNAEVKHGKENDDDDDDDDDDEQESKSPSSSSGVKQDQETHIAKVHSMLCQRSLPIKGSKQSVLDAASTEHLLLSECLDAVTDLAADDDAADLADTSAIVDELGDLRIKSLQATQRAVWGVAQASKSAGNNKLADRLGVALGDSLLRYGDGAFLSDCIRPPPQCLPASAAAAAAEGKTEADAEAAELEAVFHCAAKSVDDFVGLPAKLDRSELMELCRERKKMRPEAWRMVVARSYGALLKAMIRAETRQATLAQNDDPDACAEIRA